MAEPKSINSYFSFREEIRNFLIPSWVEVALYLLSSLVILSLVNISSIWGLLNDGANITSAQVLVVDLNESRFGALLESPFMARLSTFLLWAFIGAMVYVCFWFAEVVFSKARNDVRVTTYNFPTRQNKDTYVSALVHRTGLLVCLAVTAFGLFYTLLALVLPLCSTAFYVSLYELPNLFAVLRLVGACLIQAILFYFLVLVIRTFSHIWKS